MAAAATQQDTISEPPTPTAAPTHNTSSLYVGDLDREVTEAQLYDVFSQIGPVASIRVCRDNISRRSLGYAYVNYNAAMDATAAERALETLNYAPLGGAPMRIMWSHRDPATRKAGVGNIFIKNLDRDIDNKALHDTFSAFGVIQSCKVALDATGQSKGYGFVHYETDEAAQLAIDKVNGMLLEGKKVYVGPFQKQNERPDRGEVKFTNVFVKNLAESVDDDKLRELFSKFGEVTSVTVMKDEEGKSRCFGFVNFENTDDAAEAVEEMNDKEVEGKVLFAGRAQKKAEREASIKQKIENLRDERTAKFQGMNLYVKNLVDEVDDDALREEFEQYGTISSAKVMRDSGDKSKGFGFVCFTSPDEASRAVGEANNKMLKGKPLYVALAQRQDVRKAQLEQQYNAPRLPAGGRGAGGPNGGIPGMYGMPAANAAMFYNGGPMPGRGAAPYGFPQMVGRGAMGGRGGRGRGRMQPAFGPDYGAVLSGFPVANGFAAAGMVPRGGRGGRGGRFNGRGDFGPEAYFAGPEFGGRGGRGPGGRGLPDGGRGGRGGPFVPRGGPQLNGARGPGPVQVPPQGPMPPPQQPQTPMAASAVVPGPDGAGGGNLTTAMLVALPPDQQKQMLGERLFPEVMKVQPELAGKITGMLLEMDNSELLLLLESQEALQQKVDEAMTVLKQHNALPDGLDV